MPRSTKTNKKPTDANFFLSPLGKWVTIDLEESDNIPLIHESLDYYKVESIRPNNTKDCKNLEYLPISSRNLRKLNWKTNRSTSQESLVGAMIKGTSFKKVYKNSEIQNSKNESLSGTSEYFNVNQINPKVTETVKDKQWFLTQQKKICWMSLISPTLSLFEGNMYDSKEKEQSKVVIDNAIEKDEVDSLLHWSTDES